MSIACAACIRLSHAVSALQPAHALAGGSHERMPELAASSGRGAGAAGLAHRCSPCTSLQLMQRRFQPLIPQAGGCTRGQQPGDRWGQRAAGSAPGAPPGAASATIGTPKALPPLGASRIQAQLMHPDRLACVASRSLVNPNKAAISAAHPLLRRLLVAPACTPRRFGLPPSRHSLVRARPQPQSSHRPAAAHRGMQATAQTASCLAGPLPPLESSLHGACRGPGSPPHLPGAAFRSRSPSRDGADRR